MIIDFWVAADYPYILYIWTDIISQLSLPSTQDCVNPAS